MASHPKTHLSPEQYLVLERQANHRSELRDGEMVAMAGASRRHVRIVTNLVVALDNQLRGSPCNVYSNDLRVKVSRTGLYTYPDVVVTCGEEQFDDTHNDTLLNPIVLIEVLSESTEAYDRGEKFQHYQQLESLAEYLLISQEPYRVEQYSRHTENLWLYSLTPDPKTPIRLRSIRCELALDEIYRNIP
jgi:Uma2 family endonuclease